MLHAHTDQSAIQIHTPSDDADADARTALVEESGFLSLPPDLWHAVVKSFVCEGDYYALAHTCQYLLLRMSEVTGEYTFPKIHLSSYTRLEWVKAMRFRKSSVEVVFETESVMRECARRGDIDVFLYLLHYCSYLERINVFHVPLAAIMHRRGMLSSVDQKYGFVFDLVQYEHVFLLEHLLFRVTRCRDRLYHVIAHAAVIHSKSLVLSWLHATMMRDDYFIDIAYDVLHTSFVVTKALWHACPTTVPPFCCVNWLCRRKILTHDMWPKLKRNSCMIWLLDPSNYKYDTHQLRRWLVEHGFTDASWYLSAFFYSDAAMARALNRNGAHRELNGHLLRSRGFDLELEGNRRQVDRVLDWIVYTQYS